MTVSSKNYQVKTSIRHTWQENTLKNNIFAVLVTKKNFTQTC